MNIRYKSLGRKFGGDFRERGEIEINYSLLCAYVEYKAFRHPLEGKHQFSVKIIYLIV